MSDFDPNGVGISNGNIFGFPVTYNESTIVLHGIPWDLTASYGKGTSNAPRAILDASIQLDFFHPQLKNASETKVLLHEIDKQWKSINDELTPKVLQLIEFLEGGGIVAENEAYRNILNEVNAIQLELLNDYSERINKDLQSNKIVGVIGGEHSTPLALINSLAQNSSFGILQIDAHADLRDSYEGFDQSHASVMYNALKNENVTKIVQIGVRDIAQSEVDLINNSNGRIKTFFDWDLKNEIYQGALWSSQVKNIISHLPDKVYVSFDIDGLQPALCPNTGTPVPGGFSLEEITYLLFELAKSEKEIIGFDLNEVGVGTSDWDANVGARALWNLICAVELNRKKAH